MDTSELNELLPQEAAATFEAFCDAHPEQLRQLAIRVAYLLDRDPEQFFQIAYRLDISEQKLVQALAEEDAATQIALLIFHRQWQKAVSRSQTPPVQDADAELSW